MRKTNNLPWMGRIAVTAMVMLVSLGVFAGSAQAQGTTFYEFSDAAAWWDAYECAEMRLILGAADGTLAPASRACKGFAALARADQRIIEDFIDPATATAETNDVGPFKGIKEWWNDTTSTGDTTAANSACLMRQRLAGAVPIAATSADTDAGPQAFCLAFDGTSGLRPAQLAVVNMAGAALAGLSGGGMMPTPTPAVPLVGIGILGLLLAGRGAWLRRRA